MTGQLQLLQGTSATVSNAVDANHVSLFIDSADGVLKYKDDAGTVTPAASGVASINSLTGAITRDQLVGITKTIQRQAADITNATNTLVELTDLSATLENSKSYIIHYYLCVNQIAVAGTSEMRVRMEYTDVDFAVGQIRDHNGNGRVENQTNESAIQIQTALEDQYIPIEVFVRTSAAGTPIARLDFGIESNTAGFDLTVKADSIITIEEL